MPKISETEAIKEFAAMVTPMIAAPPKSGQIVLDAFLQFYRDVQITGAEDSLMLQAGASTPHCLTGFTDLREISPAWEEDELQWIGLTRQVLAGREDDDSGLSIFLYFDAPDGSEETAFVELWGLGELEGESERFQQNRFVAKLLGKTPSRINGFVAEIG